MCVFVGVFGWLVLGFFMALSEGEKKWESGV